MSSLRVRIDEQLELYSKFLGSSDVVLNTIEIPMKVEEDRSSLKLFAKNRFEGKSTKTKAENQSRTSRRGSTNSTSNFAKTKFEDQSKTCRGTSRFVETKSEN
jgi:hypothetical protein